MALQHRLLNTLLDGKFHSGEHLATELGVTRAAIWKQIKILQTDFGLDIHAVTGKGYRLPEPFELLSSKIISDAVSEKFPDIEIETLLSIDSTNKYLQKQETELTTGNCKVVFAEQQTAGRGRRGRQWISPFGGNLYFSIRRQFDTVPSNITGLSLAVGVAIVEYLKNNGVKQAALKWPNDILVEGRKLCGILLEMHGETHGPYAVIIGIGLNLNMPATQAAKIDQPWIALNQVCKIGLSRNQLAAGLLMQILFALDDFERHGLEPFRERWLLWDSYMNSEVVLRLGERKIRGIVRGIDQHGALLIEQQGQIQRYYSGEISLRPR